jgi:colanic acid/amylovoran biosynthesis glycosyltransferase
MKFPLIRKKYRRIKLKFNWSIVFPLKYKFYWSLVKNLKHWPLDLFSRRIDSGSLSNRRRKIAYYLWEYPALSQTFIQREISALKNSFGDVLVFSDISGEGNTENNKFICLMPLNKKKLRRYKRQFLKNNPLNYVNLFLYTLFHNYHFNKTYVFDKATFNTAVYLAGLLKENNINHIHSPWADRCAFISLIASRLVNISYSVQARAHDIHRDNYLFGFEEKFGNADFVVTNTRYNLEYLHTRLNDSLNGKVNLIYNGLNLEKFIPNHKNNGEKKVIKLLCVSRLIEQKGLVNLLYACKELKDKEYKFTCEIIGGPESLYMNYYIALKKLHKKLELQEIVFFLDAIPFDEVLKHFSNTDIFVLPCLIAEDGSRDITPNALIEAMAMKLPVISTTVTGVPEIVDDGVNGILIPPNNIEALIEAIEKLIGDPQLRKHLGENARKKVEERFDIKKNINNYVHLFEK